MQHHLIRFCAANSLPTAAAIAGSGGRRRERCYRARERGEATAWNRSYGM